MLLSTVLRTNGISVSHSFSFSFISQSVILLYILVFFCLSVGFHTRLLVVEDVFGLLSFLKLFSSGAPSSSLASEVLGGRLLRRFPDLPLKNKVHNQQMLWNLKCVQHFRLVTK